MPLTPATTMLGRAALGVALITGLYATLLGVLLTPTMQRFALYAHKFNTLFVDDLHDPPRFGFAKNQVTPFKLNTPDGETLFAWHVLPIDVYARNEKILCAEERPHAPVEDFTTTTAFRLLTGSDPAPARVVVSFHGNAGHIAQGWRPDTFRYLTTQPNTHVLTIDYRGFGLSTGSPTEAGLITDGTTLVDWVMRVAGIPPERIVILGQSLGTAVSSAVALHFADPQSALIPAESRELRPLLAKEGRFEPIAFAGIILVAPFSSVPSLLLTYRIGGLLPLLLPLRPFPYIAGLLTSQMSDKWLSADRLSAYYRALAASPRLKSDDGGRSMASLQLFHATNDVDITYRQSEIICRRIFAEGSEPGTYDDEQAGNQPVKCIDGSHGATVLDVKREGRPRLRFEILDYGAHNRIITYSPIAAALVRAFDDVFD